MDAQTLERIETLVSASQAVRAEGGAPLHTPAIITPDNCSLHSLERYLEAPTQQRVRYSTHRPQDFVNYVNEEALAESQTAVFISPDGDGAEAYVDFGCHEQPLHKLHTAQLKMKRTPEFDALRALCSESRDQRAVIEWLEDWTDHITPMRGSEELQVSRAITELRKVDIKAIAKSTHEHQDFSASKSSFAEIDAKAAGKNPPSEFILSAPVYHGTDVRQIRVRLSLGASGDEPRFRLRILGEDALYQAVADELEQLIREYTADVRVFVGNAKAIAA